MLLYSIKRFLEVFASLVPSTFLSKERKFLFWHTGPSLKARDPDKCPLRVVSCSNSHSSSSVHFTLEASSLLLFAHYPKKVADQAAQLRGELWAGCFIPTPTARSVWLMPRDELLSPGCTGYGGSLDGWLKCSASLCEGQTLTHLVLQGQSQALNGAVWT